MYCQLQSTISKTHLGTECIGVRDKNQKLVSNNVYILRIQKVFLHLSNINNISKKPQGKKPLYNKYEIY